MTFAGALGARRSRGSYRLALGALACPAPRRGRRPRTRCTCCSTAATHDFADASPFAFVRDTWASLVVPHETFFVTLLVAFEATAGVLVLVGGRGRRVALVLITAFHVALLSFSAWYLAWSVPMVAAMVLLLQADRQWRPGVSRGPSSSRSAGRAATAHG